MQEPNTINTYRCRADRGTGVQIKELTITQWEEARDSTVWENQTQRSEHWVVKNDWSPEPESQHCRSSASAGKTPREMEQGS